MNSVKAYQVYQQNQVFTAPQEKLVTMLYDGALRFINQAKQGIEEKDIEKANQNFIKAQRILAELMGNLDRSVGEVAENLFSVYDYMYRSLVEANIKKDGEKAQEIYDMLKELRDTWVQATKQVPNPASASPGPGLNLKSE